VLKLITRSKRREWKEEARISSVSLNENVQNFETLAPYYIYKRAALDR